MKWFKHICKSRNDALIRDAITLFGLAGEHVFWRTMEVMGDEFNVKTPGYNKFLVKSWIKNYETSLKKTIKILSFFHNYSDKKKRIFFKIRGHGKYQTIQLNCPKLKTMCDTWTHKMIKQTSKLNRSENEPPSRKEEEVEVEAEDLKDKPFGLPSQDELNNSALIKVRDDIEQVSKKLYDEKIFPKVYAFKNKMLKDGKNERTILHVLSRCYLKRKFKEGAWAYCMKIIQVEDGNYNERDYLKTN